MALTRLPMAEKGGKKTTKPATPPAGLTWKDRFPKRITAEDAENEPKHERLFP